MKTLCLLAVVLLAGQEKKQDDYFPLKAGHKWKYKNSNGETFTVQVIGKKPDKSFAMKLQEKGKSTELRYSETKDGVKLVSESVTSGGRTFDRGNKKPRLFIKTPLKKGNRWKFGTFQVVNLGKAKVKVKAGGFTCFKLKMVWTAQGPVPNSAPTQVTRMVWLAPGVGIVKETTTSEGGLRGSVTFTRQLVKFEKGKPKKK